MGNDAKQGPPMDSDRGRFVLSFLGILCILLVGTEFSTIFTEGLALIELSGRSVETRWFAMPQWFAVLRLDNNAYHRWLIDPITSFLSSNALRPTGRDLLSQGLANIWITQLIVLGVGIFNILRVNAALFLYEAKLPRGALSGWISWLIGSLLVTLTVGLLAPMDIVSLGSICWLPLLFSLFSLLGEGLRTSEDQDIRHRADYWGDLSSFCLVGMIGIVALMHLLSASFLAPLTLLFFWGVLGGKPLLGFWGLRDSKEPLTRLSWNRVAPVACFLFFSLWIALIWHGAAAILPDYPANASVVPDDGVPGITRPLTSSDYRLMVSHPFLLSDFWGIPTAILTPFLAAWVFDNYRKTLGNGSVDLELSKTGDHRSVSNCGRDNQKVPGLTIAILSGLFCLLDLYLPVNLQEIAPISSFSRIYPGAFLIPIVPVLFSLSVLVFLIVALLDKQHSKPKIFFGCIALLGALPILNSGELTSCGKPREQDTHQIANSDEESRGPGTTAICKSPSRWLVSNYGEATVEGYRKNRLLQSTPLPLKEAVAFNTSLTEASGIADAPPLPALGRILTDHHNNTRWASANHGQHGVEWLQLNFIEETLLDGILLATGDFKSDFPAALKVECVRTDTTITEAFNIKEWLGPLLFTEAGYPYLGSASDVRVIFPKRQSCTSLIIHQTGQRPLLDWSIAEVRGLIGPS